MSKLTNESKGRGKANLGMFVFFKVDEAYISERVT